MTTQANRAKLKTSSLLPALVLLMGIPVAFAGTPRARTLIYDPNQKEWLETPPPVPGTPEGDLLAIRKHLTEGRFRKALTSTKKFSKHHGERHDLTPQVVTAKAEALIGQRKFYKAHLLLKDFLNRYGGMAHASEAIRLEFVIAEAFLSGVKRPFLGMRLLSTEDLAIDILDDISVNYPDTSFAELAIKTKADHLFRQGDYSLAELEYSRLLRDYPQSRYHRFSMRRSSDAALASFRGIDFDDAALVEAEERFRDYQARYGAWANQPKEDVDSVLAAIVESRAEKEFSIGAYYERTDHLGSAMYYYRSIVSQWPDSLAAVKAKQRMAVLGVGTDNG